MSYVYVGKGVALTRLSLTGTLCSLFLGTFAVPAIGQSPAFHFGALAGASLSPSRCGSAGCPLGFNGGIYAEYEAREPFGVRLEATFTRWNGDAADPHFATATNDAFAGLLEAVLTTHHGRLRLFLVTGGGLAQVTASATGYSPFSGAFRADESETVFAWRIGGGIGWAVGNRMSIVLEVKYLQLATSAREVIVDNLGFVEFAAGVRF